jgi:hypothetical protein
VLRGCQHGPAAPFDYRSALGILVEKVGGTCLEIRNANLSSGQRIPFVTAALPQTTGEVEILAKTAQACTADGSDKPGLSHYAFKVVRGSLQKAAPAFAVINFTGQFTEDKGSVSADLEGNGRRESFRSCTSSEGVHLTVWEGKPLEGLRKWHDYYYLGYEVDPTCTKVDTAPDTP